MRRPFALGRLLSWRTIILERRTPVDRAEVPPEYRSHGSLHEVQVPLYAYNNEFLPYPAPPRHNKDLLTPLLNGWIKQGTAHDTRIAFATDRAYLRKPGPTGATTL
jgi:hypothetical protein